MIRNKLYSLFVKIFEKELEAELYTALKKLKEKQEEHNRDIEISVLSQWIDRPVICFNNEADLPVIGFGTRIEYITKASNPVLVVYDYLKQKEQFILSGKIYRYRTDLLDAFFKLKPSQLIGLLFHYADSFEDKNKKPYLHTLEEVEQALNDSGFHQRAKQFAAREAAASRALSSGIIA